MAFEVSLGSSKYDVDPKLHEIKDIAHFKSWLETQDSRFEKWFSGIIWQDNRRAAKNFLYSTLLVADLDYEPHGKHDFLTDDAKTAIKSTSWPCNLWYLTPCGMRCVVVLDAPCADSLTFQKAQLSYCRALEEIAAPLNLHYDQKCQKSLAAFYYCPNAKVSKDVTDPITGEVKAQIIQRRADVVVVDETPKPLDAFRLDWVDIGGGRERKCPFCGHRGCFGPHPKDPGKWFCFSSNHSACGYGLQNAEGYSGDVIDYESFLSKKPIKEILSRVETKKEQHQRATDVVDEKTIFSAGDFPTLMDLLRVKENQQKVFGGALRFCTCSLKEFVGDSKNDQDLEGVLMENVPRFFCHLNKKEEVVKFQVEQSHARKALSMLFSENRFDSLKEYVESFRWDGVERISFFARKYLHNKRPIVDEIVRKWFISLAARAIEPGCQVDTVLILVGQTQGEKKTSLGSIIAGPYYGSFANDPTSKDGLLKLRGRWLIEWPELSAMAETKSIDRLKAFITERVDDFRKPYGHVNEEFKRSCVLFGTSNEKHFLTDKTGNRRFWPLLLDGKLDLDAIAAERAQLIAEAVHLKKQGEHWWFDDETALENYRFDFTHEDPIHNRVREYLKGSSSTTINSVLGSGLQVEVKDMPKLSDRVEKIMIALGWVRTSTLLLTGFEWIKKVNHFVQEVDDDDVNGNVLELRAQ